MLSVLLAVVGLAAAMIPFTTASQQFPGQPSRRPSAGLDLENRSVSRAGTRQYLAVPQGIERPASRSSNSNLGAPNPYHRPASRAVVNPNYGGHSAANLRAPSRNFSHSNANRLTPGPVGATRLAPNPISQLCDGINDVNLNQEHGNPTRGYRSNRGQAPVDSSQADIQWQDPKLTQPSVEITVRFEIEGSREDVPIRLPSASYQLFVAFRYGIAAVNQTAVDKLPESRRSWDYVSVEHGPDGIAYYTDVPLINVSESVVTGRVVAFRYNPFSYDNTLPLVQVTFVYGLEHWTSTIQPTLPCSTMDAFRLAIQQTNLSRTNKLPSNPKAWVLAGTRQIPNDSTQIQGNITFHCTTLRVTFHDSILNIVPPKELLIGDIYLNAYAAYAKQGTLQSTEPEDWYMYVLDDQNQKKEIWNVAEHAIKELPAKYMKRYVTIRLVFQ